MTERYCIDVGDDPGPEPDGSHWQRDGELNREPPPDPADAMSDTEARDAYHALARLGYRQP